MTTSDNQLGIRHSRAGFKFVPPKYTLGYLIIVVGVTIMTSIVILSGNFSTWQADGQKIIDEKQLYRLFTGPFAVASFLDLSFMLISFLWLLFTVTQYENRNSTIYTIYHFWKTNILIAISVSGLYWIMFNITGMKNFIMNVGGIYPYTLHMYLKNCLEKPSEIVNHWFLPCPVNRWVMGYLVSLLSVALAPESQGCLVVHLNYIYCSFLILLKYVTGCKCFYYEGPFLPIIFTLLQKILPNCIKTHYGFCSMQEYYRRQQQIWEQERKQTELAQENGDEIN